MFKNVIKNIPEFYHMNTEEMLTHLLMHEWKYVTEFLDEAWSITTQKIYNR